MIRVEFSQGTYSLIYSLFIVITRDNILHAVFTVHLGGGIWGVLSVPIFNKESGILYSGSLLSFRGFGWNLLGVIVIMAWSAALAFLLFIILHLTKQLRVSEEIELKGEIWRILTIICYG